MPKGAEEEQSTCKEITVSSLPLELTGSLTVSKDNFDIETSVDDKDSSVETSEVTLDGASEVVTVGAVASESGTDRVRCEGEAVDCNIADSKSKEVCNSVENIEKNSRKAEESPSTLLSSKILKKVSRTEEDNSCVTDIKQTLFVGGEELSKHNKKRNKKIRKK